MRFRIQLEGFQQLERELHELDERVNQPLTPLLDVFDQQIASWAQDRISTSGADLEGTPFAWPPHHPATIAIRRKYGHEGKPMLWRGGNLFHDIRGFARGPDWTEIGSKLPWAGDTHDGGTVTRGGHRREVPARPFLVVTEPQMDELAELVAAYFAGDEGAPGA